MASAVEVARLTLDADRLLLAQRRKLLSQAIWWYTECDGKFTTRYRSADVVGELDEWTPVGIRHEHVVQRRGQIDRMLERPADVESIMSQNLACVVSTTEHELLKPYDHLDGWSRYDAAGIVVVDMLDRSRVDFSSTVQQRSPD